MSALQSYLDNRGDLDAIAPDILQAAQGLLNEDPHGDKTIIAKEREAIDAIDTVDDDSKQLRLL